MRIDNAHSRVFPGRPDRVGKLIDSLSGTNDCLWPHERWPAMQFDRPLGVGANGGHGPIRYRVVEYEASRWVRFAFTRPKGFHGYHEWEVLSAPNGCELRHALAIETTGLAVASWPLIWRPMHDALIEDALDKAARQLVAGPLDQPLALAGAHPAPHRHPDRRRKQFLIVCAVLPDN